MHKKYCVRKSYTWNITIETVFCNLVHYIRQENCTMNSGYRKEKSHFNEFF